MTTLLLALQKPAAVPSGDGETIRTSWEEGTLRVPVDRAGIGARPFLLDTGTGPCYLTPKGFARYQAAGGRLQADGTLTVEGLRLGGIGLPPLNFAPEARGFAKLSLGNVADGYLGTDAFRTFRLGLNLSRNEARLFPGTEGAEAARAAWFGTGAATEATRLYERGGGRQYAIDVDVNGLTLPMLFDTGSGTTFVREDLMAFVEGAEAAHGDARRYYGGTLQFGQARVYWVAPSGTSMGGRRRIGVFPVAQGYTGVFGRDGITPYRVLLDYPGGKAYFADAEGRRSGTRPTYDGPAAASGSGLTRRWRRGVTAHVPMGWTAECPPGYAKTARADGGFDLVPLTGIAPQ